MEPILSLDVSISSFHFLDMIYLGYVRLNHCSSFVFV